MTGPVSNKSNSQVSQQLKCLTNDKYTSHSNDWNHPNVDKFMTGCITTTITGPVRGVGTAIVSGGLVNTIPNVEKVGNVFNKAMFGTDTYKYEDASTKTVEKPGCSGIVETYKTPSGKPVEQRYQDFQDGDTAKTTYHSNGEKKETTYITERGVHTVKYNQKGEQTDYDYNTGSSDSSCNLI